MNFSTLKIYGTIPFQKDYKHTIDFESKNEQKKYFSTEFNKKGKSFSDFLYIDEYQKIIVEGAKGKFDGYNYLSFVNGDSDRTFYCFIDRFEYVSEDSTAIYFTVDVMQTYMFDYTLKESYVERMHTERWNTDLTINTKYCYTNEGFLINEYDKTEIWKEKADDDFSFVKLTFAKENLKDNPNNTMEFYSFYIPVLLDYVNPYAGNIKINGNKALPFSKIFKMNGINDLISVQLVSNLPQPYVYDNNNFIVPEADVGEITADGKTYKYIANVNRFHTYLFEITKYLPNCATNINLKKTDDNEVKLYSPQFIKMKLLNFINLNEDIDILKLNTSSNNSDTLQIQHYIGGNTLANETIRLERYEGRFNKFFFNANRNIAFSKDSFLSYMNNSGIKDIANIAIGLVGAIASSNPLTLLNSFGGISNMIQADYMADKVTGNSSDFVSGAETCGLNNYIYLFKPKNIEDISDYFNVYGYNVSCVTKINTKNRYWFNFIKTKECNITTNIHNEISNAIKDIYNAGITFWHYNNGNYKWLDYDCNNIERSIATI